MDSIENAAEERMRDHFERKKGQEVQEIQERLEVERAQEIQERLERASISVESVHEDNRRKDSLLNEILPKSVTNRLLKGEPVVTETYDAVTVFFSDIVGKSFRIDFLSVVHGYFFSGFTDLSSSSSPLEIVTMLNQLYTVLDHISSLFDVYKVHRYL